MQTFRGIEQTSYRKQHTHGHRYTTIIYTVTLQRRTTLQTSRYRVAQKLTISSAIITGDVRAIIRHKWEFCKIHAVKYTLNNNGVITNYGIAF